MSYKSRRVSICPISSFYNKYSYEETNISTRTLFRLYLFFWGPFSVQFPCVYPTPYQSFARVGQKPLPLSYTLQAVTPDPSLLTCHTSSVAFSKTTGDRPLALPRPRHLQRILVSSCRPFYLFSLECFYPIRKNFTSGIQANTSLMMLTLTIS